MVIKSVTGMPLSPPCFKTILPVGIPVLSTTLCRLLILAVFALVPRTLLSSHDMQLFKLAIVVALLSGVTASPIGARLPPL